MMIAAPRLKMLAIAVGALGACQAGSSPLESPEMAAGTGPARIELGTVTDAEGRVTMPRTVFSPRDTVRLSVGRLPGADTVTVRWIRVDGAEPGVAIDSTSQMADSVGMFSFSASRASGWPLGRYAAEVTVGGRRAGSGTFEVR
jgi:hypothetical protein